MVPSPGLRLLIAELRLFASVIAIDGFAPITLPVGKPKGPRWPFFTVLVATDDLATIDIAD